MTVHIPSPLLSYTDRRDQIDLTAASIADLLGELDRRFPGIRFRMIDEQDGIREHIRFFVNGEPVHDLRTPLPKDAEVHIICAISGGSGTAEDAEHADLAAARTAEDAEHADLVAARAAESAEHADSRRRLCCKVQR